MHFTNSARLRLVSMFLLSIGLLLLTACASQPSSTSGATTASATQAVAARPVNIPNQAIKDYQVAIAAMDAKQWPKAEVLLQEMQANYPQLTSVRVNLAVAYNQQQRAEEAINELEAVISDDRLVYSDAHNLLAIMYREQGQFSEAETIYREAIKRWPSEPALSRNLGILYDLYLDQPAQALAAYQQALSLMSKPDKALKRWVKQLSRRTQQQSNKAVGEPRK